MERNPKLGICPCCEDETQIFLQTVQSESILKCLTRDGIIHRGYQYCNNCIDGAKDQVRQAVARQREAQTHAHVQAAQAQPPNQPQFPIYSPSVQSITPRPSQYSPISEAGARGTPDPFFEPSNASTQKTLGLSPTAQDEPMHSPTAGSEQGDVDDEETQQMQAKRKLAKAQPK